MKRKGILFVITGPSGSGKTAIIKKILRSLPHVQFSISYTTRRRRTGEKDHRDYHFVSEKDFKKILKRRGFLEWAVVFGHYYGTPAKETEKILTSGTDLLLDIDIQGASQVKSKRPEAVFIFIVPPDFRTLKKRLEKRQSESKETREERLKIARKEIGKYQTFDYLVVNDDLDDAVHLLKSIIISERAKMLRNAITMRKIEKSFY